MSMTKKEAEHFIFKAKENTAKLKYHVFCTSTSIDMLPYAMKRYEIYDSAITFYTALCEWINEGIISAENAYNCAFERNQKIMTTAA